MEQVKIKAKKSLGQNFLHSKVALFKMCESANLKEGDTIIEIGPGKGALTELLLEKGAKVIAIEKDERLITFLNEKFEKYTKNSQFILINGDALTIEIKKIGQKTFVLTENSKNQIVSDYKIIANIPYYITGALIRICLEQSIKPSSLTFLVQKEVADRIVANDGKQSLLSLSVQFYGEAKKIMSVSNKSFKPVPKVHSAIINININKESASNKEQGKFFDLIHRGFAHKRKTLRKNLIDSGLPKEIVDQAFNKLSIDDKTRAEDINPKTWILLSKELY